MSRLLLMLLKTGFLLFVLLIAYNVRGQLLGCTSGNNVISFISADTIYNFNPSLPLSANNPVRNSISPPPNSNGLVVSTNLNSSGPSPTFYTISSGVYYYYNGNQWISTGHTAGGISAINPGSGGRYIYNIEGVTGNVYRYDGTTNATLVTTINDFIYGGPFDVVGDCRGNFYVLRTDTTGAGQYLRKYDSTGTMLQSWSVNGAVSSTSGGGFSITGDRIYYNNNSGYWGGIIGLNSVNFNRVSQTGILPEPKDFASCPLIVAGDTVQAYASEDTVYFCGNEQRVVYADSINGNETVSWKVISGNAVINSTGDTALLSITENSRILLSVINPKQCAAPVALDTVTLILNKGKVYGGLDRTILGCNTFQDTLNATISDTISGIEYKIKWLPENLIKGPADILNPIVSINSDTSFIVMLYSHDKYGGCKWQDTVNLFVRKQIEARIAVSDTTPCVGDTVMFSAEGSKVFSDDTIVSYEWWFGDKTYKKGKQIKHVYSVSGTYNIRLVITDAIGCRDTAVLDLGEVVYSPYIDLGADTTICNDVEIALNRHSDVRSVVSYKWYDGSTNDRKNVSKEGVYYVDVSNRCNSYRDSIIVSLKDCSLWLPNTFTPNGDGLNDLIKVYSKHLDNIEGYHMLIFNRFGEKIYDNRDINKGWDGTYRNMNCDIGTYYYMIRYQIRGSLKGSYLKKGDIMLLK